MFDTSRNIGGHLETVADVAWCEIGDGASALRIDRDAYIAHGLAIVGVRELDGDFYWEADARSHYPSDDDMSARGTASTVADAQHAARAALAAYSAHIASLITEG